MKHFISVNQLDIKQIYETLALANSYQNGIRPMLHHLFVANLFFEPSTRTKMSFIIAEKKLGLHVLDFTTATSSVQKGETLLDTVKSMEAIGANLLVIRHSTDNWYQDVISHVKIPVINAGAGKLEHPTQCMLDLMTIYEEYGNFSGLNIAIVGDIKHSRVAKSNADALTRLGANVFLSAAPGLEDFSLNYSYLTMDEVVEECEVVMLLRIQHERHRETVKTNEYLATYGLTEEREKRMKKNAIIMHPGPVNRNVEIANQLIDCKKSRIFKQMSHGVNIRMAIIMNVLKEWGIADENIIKKC